VGRLVASMTATFGLLLGLLSSTPPSASAAGGSLTALELTGSTGTWSILDPLPDTTAGEHWDFYNSIYGMLFQPGPNGKILPDIAQSWKTTDHGLQFDIMLRHGVNFTDGTPLNADAVVFNLQRDFDPKNACGCLNNFTSVKSVSKVNNYEVAINLKNKDINLIDGFPEEAPNWMISPTAFQKEGETNFGQQPVGAGPFVVVQNSPSTKLALKANPNYWDKGEPKLSSLTFVTVNSDLNAIQAMQAGSGDVYPGLSTPSVVETVKSANQFAVYKAPSIQSFTININNQHPPFNNILAREALYYALDPVTMNKAIEGGLDTISESPTGPGGLFWTPKVPNYRTYNLAKAKALVKQLGGLSFTLWTITPSPLVPVIEAEESQFAAAGINSKIELVNLPTMVHAGATGAVQAVSTSVGNYNPSILPGVPFAYLSTSPFSNVKDPNLDKLIYAAIAAPTLKAEGQDYRKVFSYLNQEAYAPYLFTVTRFLTAKKNVKGLDPSAPEIPWQSVSG
jgi:ABC-type transport system substrate-binding protein